jgi:hypothetical protein
MINKIEQNVLIEEVSKNSFNIILEQTVSNDPSNLIANTIVSAPFFNETNKAEELVVETVNEM